MNKKAWYTFRIVLGGYLAWLGIRMLIEMVNEKPNNMVFMCAMSVIFILIGSAYAVYYVKKMFDLKKEDRGIEEENKEVFDVIKDSADQKRRKNVLMENKLNTEMEKKAEQERKTEPKKAAESKTQAEPEQETEVKKQKSARSKKESERQAEEYSETIVCEEVKTVQSVKNIEEETEKSDDKAETEMKKSDDKKGKDTENEMIEETGENQELDLVMEDLVEETETEIENDYEER